MRSRIRGGWIATSGWEGSRAPRRSRAGSGVVDLGHAGPTGGQGGAARRVEAVGDPGDQPEELQRRPEIRNHSQKEAA